MPDEDLKKQVKAESGQDPIPNIHSSLSAKYNLADLETFRKDLNTEQGQRATYNLLADEFNMGSFEQFRQDIDPHLPKSFLEKAGETIKEAFTPSEAPEPKPLSAPKPVVDSQLRFKTFQNIFENPEQMIQMSNEERAGLARILGVPLSAVQHPAALELAVNKIIESGDPNAQVELDPKEVFDASVKGFESPGDVLETVKNVLSGKGFASPERTPQAQLAGAEPIFEVSSLLPEEPPDSFMSSNQNPKVRQTLWGLNRGVAKFVEGLSTPDNLALMIGTAGTSGPLMPAIFSADMLSQNPELVRGIAAHIKNGETQDAAELIAITALTNALGLYLGKETIERVKAGKKVTDTDTELVLKELENALADPEIEAKLNADLAELNRVMDRIGVNRQQEQVLRNEGVIPNTAERVVSREGADVTARAQAIEAELKAREALPEQTAQERAKQPGAGEALREQLAEREAAGPEIRDVSETARRRRAREAGEKEAPKITKEAVVPDEGRPVIETAKEVAEVGDSAMLVDIFREKQFEKAPPLKTSTVVGEIGGVPRQEAVRNIGEALRFLENRFPRLASKIDNIWIFSEKGFKQVKPEQAEANAVFSVLTDDAGNIIGREIYVKAENVLNTPLSAALSQESPQIAMPTPGEKLALASAKTEPVMSVTNAIATLAHELRHNRDFLTFGEKDYIALQEIGKIESRKKISERGERIAERGLRPQRYLVKLNERRARAQARTALRAFGEAFRESVKGIVETLGGDPSILPAGIPVFTEAGWKRSRPHFERAWENYKRAGKGFQEFSADVSQRLGENAGPYLDRFARELKVQSRNPEQRDVQEYERQPELIEDMPIDNNAPPEQQLQAHQTELSRMRDHARSWKEFGEDLISVEAAGKRIGAPETFQAVKNYFSVLSTLQDQGLKVAQDITASIRKGFSVKPDQKALQELALLAESKARRGRMSKEQSNQYRAALRMWDKWKKFAQENYKEMGESFAPHRNIIESMRAEIGRREAVGENVEVLRLGLRSARDIESITPEASLWTERSLRIDPEMVGLIYRTLSERGVKKVNFEEILKTGLTIPESFNIVDLTAWLGKRLGDDIAQMDIRQTALKEGIAKKAEKGVTGGVGFSGRWRRPPIKAKMWRGLVVDKTLHEWLNRLVTPRDRGIEVLQRGIGVVKMSAFYNPLFLPMYDVVQAGMLGALRPHFTLSALGGAYGGPLGAGAGFLAAEAATRTLSRGMWHMLKGSDLYYEASKKFSSTPFPNPFENFDASVRHSRDIVAFRRGQLPAAALSHGVELITDVPGLLAGKRAIRTKGMNLTPGERAMKIMGGFLPNQIIKDMYDLSWATAWALDRGVRMSTYLWLRGRDFSHNEAGQIAARVHGDYASVPERTRRFLNVPFFTPTFKIAMGKLQAEMVMSGVKGVTKGPKAWLDVIQAAYGTKPGSRKLTPREAQMAAGLLWTSSTLMASHIFMTSNGFETEEPFVKYKRRTLTDEGPKELVVTTPTPANLYIKFFNRFKRAFDPGPSSALESLASSFQWEITPAFRVASNMFSNRDDGGDPITLNTDSDLTKFFKLSKYAIYNTLQILKFLYPEGAPEQEQREAREQLAKEAGQLFEMATRPFTFRYLKDPQSSITASKIQRLQREFMRDIMEGRISPNNADEHARRLREQINEIRKDLEIEESQSPLP